LKFGAPEAEFTRCGAPYNSVPELEFGARLEHRVPHLKIISKYVLREHVGPLSFALTALTSLMLLNFISRQFGDLVGKGLPWTVIGEFFLLSIPFTVALTVPMSVLVAVLYAFSRLAAENEVTALKASGVSPWRMVTPAIVGGLVWSIGLLAFNDQVLPRANHRLKVLQEDISQAKPTFLLKEQVINPIAEGRFYLKADKIERGETGDMRKVVIYDMSDPMRRRTIYADSGLIRMSDNRTDIDLDLFHGQMQLVSTDNPGQLDRVFYDHDRIRFRDVTRDFRATASDSSSKGDREMSVCEMQDRLRIAEGTYRISRQEYEQAIASPGSRREEVAPPPIGSFPNPHGIGWVYCSLVRDVFKVKAAQAAELPPHGGRLWAAAPDTIPAGDSGQVRRDTVRARDTARVRDTARHAPLVEHRPDSIRRALIPHYEPRILTPQRGGIVPAGPPLPVLPPAPLVNEGLRRANGHGPPVAGALLPHTGLIEPSINLNDARMQEAKLRLDLATRTRNRYAIEIHKKFSLAAACLIFVILGAPLAVRFPRGGVGLVLGVSLVVFALYYVGLIGGEALANEGRVPPFWAMWGTNVILTFVGLVMLLRMGKDQNTGRGGDWTDRLDRLRRLAGLAPRSRASGKGR
jgi:lipopolysaccharide export system permease protein